MSNLSDFPNLIPDTIDLSNYMEPKAKHQVRTVEHFRNGIVRHFLGEGIPKGRNLPFKSLHDKFQLRDNEMTVWVGYKGHGKSAVISQVFVHVMEYSEPCFVISPEFTPVQLLLRMVFQRTRSREPGAEELQEWFDWAGKRLWLYDQQSSIKPDDVAPLCRYVCEEYGVKHILIDSLMKCGIAPDDYSRQKLFVDQVQNVAHNYPVHIHLVAHAKKAKDDGAIPGIHDIKGGSEIGDLVENVVAVWRNKPKEIAQSMNDQAKHEEPDAVFKVEAQRNADGWIGSVPLNFDKKSMLFYETNEMPPEAKYANF